MSDLEERLDAMIKEYRQKVAHRKAVLAELAKMNAPLKTIDLQTENLVCGQAVLKALERLKFGG